MSVDIVGSTDLESDDVASSEGNRRVDGKIICDGLSVDGIGVGGSNNK